jgi:two-component system, LytTR family, sensor kinase
MYRFGKANVFVCSIALVPTPTMLKDTILKVVFIPLLGLLLPLYSGLFVIHQYSLHQIVFSLLYFIVISLFNWEGVVRIIAVARTYRILKEKIFLKLFVLALLAVSWSVLFTGLTATLWQLMFLPAMQWPFVYNYAIMYAAVAALLVPIYEAAFLSKERELDVKIVNQLDEERVSAEMTSLKNELDPHFIFNSLTTLSHLIHTDAEKAYLFNSKLAQVYKYFLLHKERELISIHSELEFIEDYYFLLRIRHDEKIKLHINLNGTDGGKNMIVPYALQILVENAIKHNEFSAENPLNITLCVNNKCIQVANTVKPKPYMVSSTNVGLKNLSLRYKLICNKKIRVEKDNRNFIVKLPLITQ